ncbi:hypothetical protein [Sphingomonas sp. KR3-1]|uniref:hypothetical protein n=1 Tax=Sphingomonas sp. KR3-1 TaxID=3156611 RepID=UPI0032B45990
MRFAASPPIHSLAEVYVICEAIVTDRISLEQALKCADGIKHPMTKKAAREIIPAFFNYAEREKVEGLSAFKGFGTPYPIGRNPDGTTRIVPVTPTFIRLHENKLEPVFVIGWSSPGLNGYQKELLSTIIRNAILTQQDFDKSDARIICTPRYKQTEIRIVKSWSVREYANLTDQQLQEQFSRYSSALNEVIKTLRET